MLSIHLSEDAGTAAWRAAGKGIIIGAGALEPLHHPALESIAVASPNELLLVVRERCGTGDVPYARDDSLTIAPVSDERLAAEAASAREWPLQATAVRLTRVGDCMRATITSGAWGTAPLFATTARGELWAHWDPAVILRRMPTRELDQALAAHYLATFDTPYSRRTLFRDCVMLTERSVATWVSGDVDARVTVEYPDPVEPAPPRRLKPGADVEAAFLAILSSSMRRWLGTVSNVASELSGGLDSSIVSIAAARLAGAGWRTFGILLPDPYAAVQAERRRALIDDFQFLDETVPLHDALPLGRGLRRAPGVNVMPWEEIYYEAMDTLLRSAAATGVTAVMTGFGGDELCTLAADEEDAAPPRPPEDLTNHNINYLTTRVRDAVRDVHGHVDHAPEPAASASAVEAAAFASAMYLRQGIWPIHPLCTPELVRFCACLPAEWRADRQVERRVLARAGCSSLVTHGAVDSFGESLARSLRNGARQHVETLFHTPRIADLGYVDARALQRAFADWAGRDDDVDGALPFFAAATLESVVRGADDPEWR